MFFLSVPDMRGRMAFDDMADVNAAIEMALAGATSWLAAELRSRFEPGTYTELFFVDRSFVAGATQQAYLSLKRGFVSAVSSITYAAKRSELGTSAAIDLSTYCEYRLEEGLILVSEIDLSSQYVRVVYTAGFSADEDNPQIFDSDETPDWLRDAAALKTMLLFDEAAPTLRRENKMDGDFKTMTQNLKAIVTPHIRYHPYAFRPM
jgi:hypothetical protein